MLKKSLAILAAFASANTFANAPVHPSNDEPGSVYHTAAYERINGRFVRSDSASQYAAPAPASASAEWEFVDGETGWQLRQHSYAFGPAGIVHTDGFPHDTPKPDSRLLGANAPLDYIGSGA